MRMTRRVAVMLPLLLMLTAAPALAGPRDDVPIKATVTGVDSINNPAGVCEPIPGGSGFEVSWLYRSVGTGQMSHLGRLEFVVEHCSYFDLDTGTGAFNTGTTTFTAANGDTLLLSHFGTFQLEPPLSYVDMTWTIVGGTGRFEGATGSGTASPVSDLVGGTTTASFTGRISYDASGSKG